MQDVIIIAGFPAAKKTTTCSLLLKRGVVDVVFDADWARNGLRGPKLEEDAGQPNTEENGYYTGVCVAGLAQRWRVAVSIGLTRENAPSFFDQVTTDKRIALVYTDPVRDRWLTDPRTGQKSSWRDTPGLHRAEETQQHWDLWKQWYLDNHFKVIDVTGAYTVEAIQGQTLHKVYQNLGLSWTDTAAQDAKRSHNDFKNTD